MDWEKKWKLAVDGPIKCGLGGVTWDIKINPDKLEDIKRLMVAANITFLWADCVCINQTDETEKSAEIPKMFEYYRNAERCHLLMDVKEAWIAQEIVDDLKFLDHVLYHIVRSTAIDMGVINCYSTCIERVTSLFDNDYFTRVWTFQEMILGKNITMWGVNPESIFYIGQLHTWMDLAIECADKAAKLYDWIKKDRPRKCRDAADIFRGLLGIFSGLFAKNEMETELSGKDITSISFNFFKKLSDETGLAWTKLGVASKPMWETTDPSAKPVGWEDRMVSMKRCGSRLASGSTASITCHVSADCGCTIVAPFALIFEAITAVQGSSLGDTATEADHDDRIVLQDGLGLVQVGDVGKTFDVVAFSGNIQAHKLYAASCRKNKENVRIVDEVPLPSGRMLMREDFTHAAMDVMKDYGYVIGVCIEIDECIPHKNEEHFKLHTPVPSDLVDILSNDPSKQKEIIEKGRRDANLHGLRVEYELAEASLSEVRKYTDDSYPFNHLYYPGISYIKGAIANNRGITGGLANEYEDYNYPYYNNPYYHQYYSGNSHMTGPFVHEKAELAETKEVIEAEKQSTQPQKDNKAVPQLPHSKSWADVVRGTSLKVDQPITTISSPRGKEPTTSVYSSSLSGFTKSTEATQTTRLTSVSSRSKTVRHIQVQNPNPSLGILGDIQEVEEIPPSVLGQNKSGQLPQDEPRDKDDESLISQTSTTYTPEQRVDVIVRFSQAMLKGLHSHVNYGAANKSSRQHVLTHLRSALRTFAEAVEADTSEKTQAKARKMVRRLRSEIARDLQDQVLMDDQVQESNRTPIDLTDREEMGAAEKINRWDIPTPDLDFQAGWQRELDIQPKYQYHSEPSLSLPTRSESSVEQSEVEVSLRDTTQIYGTSVNPVEVMKHFSTHPAFEKLLQTTRKLFERFHSPKMDLVRQRTSLLLRRQFGKQGSNNSVAIFNLDWDLHGFLIENYDDGVHQNIDKILAVTGTMGNAQLCSVGQYFSWAWPGNEFQLLEELQSTLRGSTSKNRRRKRHPAGRVTVDLTLHMVTVHGAEDFIIAIAQQLSWLIAVCQEKQGQLSHAYVGFFEANSPETSGIATFNIDVELEVPSIQPDDSCWNAIVGPAVIVTGFPLPERHHNEQGLEMSIPVMAALADTPQAVSYRGGFVFKARHHALIPIKDFGSSIQWHLIDTYPERLEWTHIDRACPTRLGGAIKKDFWNRRSFLGWCPQVLELLATSSFDHASVQYSKAVKPPRWAQIDKFIIGFSQWGTATAEITFGKKDSFRSLRPDDYETLLDDAKDTHVILHDTTQKRAFQTNAEDLILNILLHRQSLHLSGETQNSTEKNAVDIIDGADISRQRTSTRAAMLDNAEKVFSIRTSMSNAKKEENRFKYEVKLLYSTIDGLWAQSYASGDTAVKLGVEFGQNVTGWEYMDVVNNVKVILPKSVDLKKSCGRWNDYAKDIQAIVLFGANFGDVLKPESSELCFNYKCLPRDECYLGVRVNVLEWLFDRQGSSQDQKKLSPSGLTLQGSQDLFKPCAGICSDHVVRIVKQSKSHCPLPLEKDGAIIIGEAGAGLLPKMFGNNRQPQQKRSRAQRQERQALYRAERETAPMTASQSRKPNVPPKLIDSSNRTSENTKSRRPSHRWDRKFVVHFFKPIDEDLE
ncbi:alcohol dehydrogenase [Fusarium agapanthi]|uniref:Alcohol dehydrogenase n=1 Tax=Fusarium agapanthi TaxID=1803897 RepID=A0A9P5AYK2_9HYPO|nr:alcohol dehydrogenase [Fusarium agapanthi]